MPNPSPYKARMARKQLRKAGDLRALQHMLWHALIEAQAVLDQAGEDEPDLKLKAVHALSQAGGQYVRLLEMGEFEARLAAIEATLQGRTA
jgi:hypothetical protein